MAGVVTDVKLWVRLSGQDGSVARIACVRAIIK